MIALWERALKTFLSERIYVLIFMDFIFRDLK